MFQYTGTISAFGVPRTTGFTVIDTGATTVLRADAYYDNLQVKGSILTNGFRIFVANVLDLRGVITASCPNAIGASGTRGYTIGTCGLPGIGGFGNTAVGGNGGASGFYANVGAGGKAGSGTPNAGGAAGALTSIPAAQGGVHVVTGSVLNSLCTTAGQLNFVTGGSGGGGGGGDGVNRGGGGGGGGGGGSW